MRDSLMTDFSGYKINLIKTHYTAGLDSLHFGKNKLYLTEIPKGFDVFKHDANKSNNRVGYMEIEYLLKSESDLQIKIELYYFNHDWTYNLVKDKQNWIIKSAIHGRH